LYDPVELLLAKVLFNFFKIFAAGSLLIALLILFSGEELKDPVLFFKCLALSSLGLTIVLCLISGISSYSDNQNALVSILSLPLLIPILILSMRISLISERIFLDSSVDNYLMIIGGIDLLLLSLSFLFIPIIWKS
jgi:heme exporter protein B